MKQPDLTDVGTQLDVAKYRLMAAKDDLDTANLTFQAGKFRAANNRAYCSIFHTISAVPAKEGIAFKRHKDTISYFNKNYIHTEIFPKELGRKIVKAEEIRHASDYDTFSLPQRRLRYNRYKLQSSFFVWLRSTWKSDFKSFASALSKATGMDSVSHR